MPSGDSEPRGPGQAGSAHGDKRTAKAVRFQAWSGSEGGFNQQGALSGFPHRHSVLATPPDKKISEEGVLGGRKQP